MDSELTAQFTLGNLDFSTSSIWQSPRASVYVAFGRISHIFIAKVDSDFPAQVALENPDIISTCSHMAVGRERLSSERCLEEVLSQVVGTDGLEVYAMMTGKILDLRSTLRHCGITGGCTVHVHCRLRGESLEDVPGQWTFHNASRRDAGQCVKGAVGVVRQGKICLSLLKEDSSHVGNAGVGVISIELLEAVERQANYEEQRAEAS